MRGSNTFSTDCTVQSAKKSRESLHVTILALSLRKCCKKASFQRGRVKSLLAFLESNVLTRCSDLKHLLRLDLYLWVLSDSATRSNLNASNFVTVR